MNEVVRAILERRSTRGFSAEPLTTEQIDTLAQVALASPTARNTQRWHFSFVTNKQILDDFAHEMHAMMNEQDASAPKGRFTDADFHVFYNAPLVVVISTPAVETVNRFAQVDCGIAVENLAIAAKGMGLGSVIVGMAKTLFDSSRGQRFKEAFAIPEENSFAIAICIGHNTVTKEAHPVEPNKISFVE